jgi:sigma-E factor negative regulatory protein RseC
MADQTGIVIRNENDGLARVLTDRRGACGGCHTGPGQCRSCLTSARLESQVANPLGAAVGDVVKVSLPQANLFKGAAMTYLLPIAALILGAAFGLLLGSAWGWTDAGPVMGGLGGLALGFWAVVRLGRGANLSRQMRPVITAVVRTTDQTEKPHRTSCCG